MDAKNKDFITSPIPVEILNKRLLEAACQGTSQNIRDLITAGAKINSTDKNGNTPLMIAARWGNLEAVLALTDSAGADVSTNNKLGLGALTQTIFGHAELIDSSTPPWTKLTERRLNDYQQIAFRILSSMTKETIGDIVKQNFVSLNNMVILYHQTREQFQTDILRKVWDISHRLPYDERVLTAAFMEIEQPKWCPFSLYQQEIFAAIKTCHTLLTIPPLAKPKNAELFLGLSPVKMLTFSNGATGYNRANSMVAQSSVNQPISRSNSSTNLKYNPKRKTTARL